VYHSQDTHTLRMMESGDSLTYVIYTDERGTLRKDLPLIKLDGGHILPLFAAGQGQR